MVRFQRASREGALPPYDEALLRRELDLFPDWYVARHLGRALDDEQRASLEGVFARVLANNLAQPRVFVHRDYHSRNLMVCEGNPGVLDFQDAVYGPVTYDLVSLLRDAYIAWEEERQIDWAVRYWERARAAGIAVDRDFGDFWRDFEWMGVQRQIKVLGIFARLCHRDGKTGYVNDMPLVMQLSARRLRALSRARAAARAARRARRSRARRRVHLLMVPSDMPRIPPCRALPPRPRVGPFSSPSPRSRGEGWGEGQRVAGKLACRSR